MLIIETEYRLLLVTELMTFVHAESLYLYTFPELPTTYTTDPSSVATPFIRKLAGDVIVLQDVKLLAVLVLYTLPDAPTAYA